MTKWLNRIGIVLVLIGIAVFLASWIHRLTHLDVPRDIYFREHRPFTIAIALIGAALYAISWARKRLARDSADIQPDRSH